MLRGPWVFLLVVSSAAAQEVLLPSAPSPALAAAGAPLLLPPSAAEAGSDLVVSFKKAKDREQSHGSGSVTDISGGGDLAAADLGAEPLQAVTDGDGAPARSPPPPPKRSPPPPPPRSPPPPPPGCQTQMFSASAAANSNVGNVGSFSFSGWNYDVQGTGGSRPIYRLNDQATFKVTAANGVVLCGLSLASYTAGGYASVSGTTLSGTPAPPTIYNYYIPPYPNAALLSLNQAQWTRISSVTIQTAGLGGPDLFYISYIKL